MATSGNDGTTNYMRFQDFGELNQASSTQSDQGDAMLDVEMDSLQKNLDEEEGTLKRKQRNVQDYTVSVENDPSAVMRPRGAIEQLRLKVLKVVDSIYVRAVSLLVVAIDLLLLIISVAIYGIKTNNEAEGFIVLAMIFATYFMVELGLRIFARGRAFFRYWYEILDLVVIVVSFVLTALTVSQALPAVSRISIVGRLVRVILLFRIINERYQVSRASRRAVSQNKRRYVKDGFDLDLTYVTERVIAMGYPSSGSMGWYRNNAEEVARFLDTKHPDHYKVYNLCSERAYDHELFHGRVHRLKIDDHNVPLLAELVEFCEDVHRWMEADSRNVIAVHCKGGKGRTGTVICCWLMRSGLYKDAESCLAYFGERRTDLSKGDQFQGVQTPSQSRWVGFYDQYLHAMDRTMPEAFRYKLTTVKITGINGVGAGDGRDFALQVIVDGSTVSEFALYSPAVTKKVLADAAADELTVEFKDDAIPVLQGNIKFRFSCSTKIKAKGLYDHSLFFFWVHTAFIKDFRVFLQRAELDNPHKPKTHKIFRENFAVELMFEAA